MNQKLLIYIAYFTFVQSLFNCDENEITNKIHLESTATFTSVGCYSERNLASCEIKSLLKSCKIDLIETFQECDAGLGIVWMGPLEFDPNRCLFNVSSLKGNGTDKKFHSVK